VSMETGKVLWRLGGKHSSFKIGRGANFEWQHDARMQPNGTITVFDNAARLNNVEESQSRALRIRLNFKRRRATLVHAYKNNPPLLSESEGSVEPLPDGNTFVDWGADPYLTEFSRGGRQLFSMHFPSPIETYRGFRFQWSGQPATSPSLALSRTARGTRVYVSWNGATDVSSWVVLAGASPAALIPVSRMADRGFQTSVWVPSTEPYFAAEAFSSDGQALAVSAITRR
jgi:Arylsulfotransferase (ASST)